MMVIDKGNYEEIRLECNEIIGYITKCPKCGNIIETANNVDIPECPTCKHKGIPKSKPNRCSAVHRIAVTDRDNSGGKNKSRDDYFKEYAQANPRQLRNANQLDEWYCTKHRREE